MLGFKKIQLIVRALGSVSRNGVELRVHLFLKVFSISGMES